MSNVNHPSHYNAGKIEVIEFIEDQGFGPGFHIGNAIKYAARAGKKDPAKEIEDLEKAEFYLQREIEILKAKKEGREPVRPNDMNPREEEAADKFPQTIAEEDIRMGDICSLNPANGRVRRAKASDVDPPSKRLKLSDIVNISISQESTSRIKADVVRCADCGAFVPQLDAYDKDPILFRKICSICYHKPIREKKLTGRMADCNEVNCSYCKDTGI